MKSIFRNNLGEIHVKLAVLVAVLLLTQGVVGDDMEDMEPAVEFHPVNAVSKTFHWILTLTLLLVLPSISAVLAFAEKMPWCLHGQFISMAYSIMETLFLDFPDNVDNHENRTSKGTSWFLSNLLVLTVFIGSLINGSNVVLKKFYPNLASKVPYSRLFNIYRILSTLVVLTGWVRVCMAPVALFGFCYGKHTGQCIAHGIMGSAFIGYSFILSLVLTIPWIRKHHLLNGNAQVRSQEFYDSALMCLWGIVNTFTEHRWGTEAWSMGDYQHTAMGIIWWAGGLLGVFLAKNNNRTFVPALLLIFTGWSMSQHSQHSVMSTKVHGVFGIALMASGATRIYETSSLLKDKACSETGKILNFQYIPPFCLALSGVLFMSATEEQLELVSALGSDHSAYILVAASAAFVIYLWFLLILSLYLWLVGYDVDGEISSWSRFDYENVTSQNPNEFELGDFSDEEPATDDTPPH